MIQIRRESPREAIGLEDLLYIILAKDGKLNQNDWTKERGLGFWAMKLWEKLIIEKFCLRRTSHLW
jgi:hypothetical protein